ncbi:DUF418 domain-containing protein [Fredinandcohnia humi]
MQTTNKRIQTIDGMRGLSLFGILVANMLIFQYGMWGKDEIDFFSLSKVDLVGLEFIKILVEGSFMPIFTFLFGYGMIKMKHSLVNKGKKVKRHFARRALFLLVIGILHSTFLWEGDILMFYGIMGFFLLLFLKRKKKTMLIWGVALFVLTPFLGYGNLEETARERDVLESYVVESIDVYATGGYSEILSFRNGEVPLILPEYAYVIILLLSPLLSAPLFLFGMYAAENNLFTQPKEEAFLYKIGALTLVPVGILLKSSDLLSFSKNWVGVADLLGANLLALGYICSFGLLYVYAGNSSLLRGFEAVGKLSFTNYLMQTVICTTIYYGYGLGQFGKLGVLNGFFVCIGIYFIQYVVSKWYLSHFKTGPFEKVIRVWTYLSFKGRVKENKAVNLPKEITV